MSPTGRTGQRAPGHTGAVVIDSQGNNLYETGRAAYLAWRKQEK